MRIIFMGTPEFSIPSLKILLEHGYNVVSVVTTPDKPQGRGQKIASSPVKEFSLQNNLSVLQPERLKSPDFASSVAHLQPDLIVVVAFRILPPEVFTIPRMGAFNLHASLLPKYRGAAPINWAIIQGEEESGVTTFFLQEKVDTGSILLQARLRIGPNETAGELHDRLAELGSQVVLQTVRAIEVGNVRVQPQDETLASLAPKIFREDCSIDWNKPSQQVHDFVRGLSPSPCAWTMLHRKVLRIFRTSIAERAELLSGTKAGEIVDVRPDRALVRTQTGVLALEEVQQEGRKRMGVPEFLRGTILNIGDRLGNA
ncbi:MAG: methionyl-tRNA formyltransferase [Ignavibacteriales bacterium]|nr:methionyl-tRNA formyltransferase [Ignavibacteriales bacterium]